MGAIHLFGAQGGVCPFLIRLGQPFALASICGNRLLTQTVPSFHAVRL